MTRFQMRSYSSPHKPLRQPIAARQTGATLLESLVSLLVLAVGVLGLLGLQIRTLNNSQTANYRMTAVRLAEALTERAQTYPGGFFGSGGATPTTDAYALNGDWSVLPTPGTLCNTNNCSPAQWAQFDLWEWQQSVINSLPGGQATTFLSSEDSGQLGIMLAWRLRETADTSSPEFAKWMEYLNPATPTGGPACPTTPERKLCHLTYFKP